MRTRQTVSEVDDMADTGTIKDMANAYVMKSKVNADVMKSKVNAEATADRHEPGSKGEPCSDEPGGHDNDAFDPGRFDTVNYDRERGELVILDQTLLPGTVKYLRLHSPEGVWEAIRLLRVRGAPAIGVAAAYGICVGMRRIAESGTSNVAAAVNLDAELSPLESGDRFLERFREVKDYLNSSRPTAVNLSWALNRMEKCAVSSGHVSVRERIAVLEAEADTIRRKDSEICRRLGEHGLTLISKGDGILTHCNAGALATVQYGTATAPLYLGQERGYDLRVFSCETRPLLQGARLTSYELHNAGIDVTLICDNMTASVMANGWIQAVFVGSDRVAANGDAANKIGTSGVAILAKHYGIPFYVFTPVSTIDLSTAEGRLIEIEQREPQEITDLWYRKRMAPEGVKVYNPAFDVTDHSLITAIVTECGILYPPFSESLKKAVGSAE